MFLTLLPKQAIPGCALCSDLRLLGGRGPQESLIIVLLAILCVLYTDTSLYRMHACSDAAIHAPFCLKFSVSAAL